MKLGLGLGLGLELEVSILGNKIFFNKQRSYNNTFHYYTACKLEIVYQTLFVWYTIVTSIKLLHLLNSFCT